MEGLAFYAFILVVMGVLGWLRRMQEGKAARQHMDEPGTSMEDLPEATRRQLYGTSEEPIRTARPAQRASQSAAPPPAIPTARPRQQQAPPRRQPQPTRPQPRAAQPTMQRMRSALENMAESMTEQLDQMEGRQAAPPPRRRRGKSPEQLAAEQAKRQEAARLKRSKANAARVRRQREVKAAVSRRAGPKHRLGSISEIRRGIILAEILGTPRGLEF